MNKRNLIALLMAAMLSLGTMGVALADDGGADRISDNYGTTTAVAGDAAN